MAIKSYIKNEKTLYEVLVKVIINGRQVAKRKRSITSLAFAKREEVRLKIELLRLRDQPTSYTWNQWAEKCLKRMSIEYRPSTIVGYQSRLSHWVNPKIGQIPLENITSADIHDLIFNQTGHLGHNSRRDILKHIKRIFTLAVEEGILFKNPAKGIKVKVPETKKLVFNKTEIETLLEEAKRQNHPYYNHWVLALLTGMRTGELYALQWSDIDLESGFISINKSWNRQNGFGPTKSTLNRVVPISKELEHFLRHLKSNETCSTAPVLERLQDWHSGCQAKALKEFCKNIGITPIRFHELRATFITQLLLQGVPVAKVMAIVGHSQLKTTMVYLRLVGTDLQGVTDELNIKLPALKNFDNVVNLFSS